MTNTIKEIIKTPKKDSALLYFILEANEGLCFYSTLAHEIGQEYRLIEINYDQSFEKQIMALLAHCKNTITLELQ